MHESKAENETPGSNDITKASERDVNTWEAITLCAQRSKYQRKRLPLKIQL